MSSSSPPTRTSRLLCFGLFFWVLLADLWILEADAAVPLPPGATLQSDIAYGPAPAQRLDAYLPAPGGGLAPIIFMVHGGAWKLGDKTAANVLDNKVPRWVGQGFVFISINYRMLPVADPLQQAQDVALALAYVQRNAASLGGDPTRVILMGHSAGAHLVSLVSTHPTLAMNQGVTFWLGTVSLDSAAYDVVYIMERPHLPLYDEAFGSDPTFWLATSPYHVMGQPAPPFLAVYSSLRLEAAVQAARFDLRGAQIGTPVTVLAQELTHEEINSTLGIPGTYTDEVESFLGTLDPVVAAMLGQTPPVITIQPATVATTTGNGAQFTVTGAGVAPLTYQWHRNGLAIPGATGSSYTLAVTTNTDAGDYTVVVANAAGSITSNVASLNLIPAGFDVPGYYARNSDVAAAFGSDTYGAWIHYYNFGLTEGRQFDSQFIVGEYLLLNTDLTIAFGSDLQAALLHWLTWGKPVEDRIGRVPIGFNVDSYLARYPDLAAAFGAFTPAATRNVTVWNHYLDWGVLEGRSDGDFEAYNYLATNADLAAVFGTDVESAALHWYFYGRREGRRIPANFSVTGYRTRNPDVATVWGNDLYGCWLHFRDTGVYEGRNYDDLFRVLEYRARYSDVQTAYGTNLSGVLNHWLFYGKPEGRLGRNP